MPTRRDLISASAPSPWRSDARGGAPFAEGGVFVAVIVAVASTGLAGGPLAVVLTAATAGACAAVVRGRVTSTDLIALGAGRAHLFDVDRTLLSVRVGRYRGPLRRDELAFVNGGRVHDEWALFGRSVRVLRVHRHLLDAVAGPLSL